MKRIHVHVSVGELAQSIRFYAELFGTAPGVRKADYARWMLEDPPVNFSISQRGATPGIQHLGIQVANRGELEEVYARLRRAEAPVLEVGATTCCYARSEKSWIADPQSVQWEAFLTTGESTVYGQDSLRADAVKAAEPPCCAPSCCTSAAV